MNHPDCFYYTETQSGKQYQRHASGKPDISRLVRGHPDYWVSPSLKKESKKKKLILADWSIVAWSDEKLKMARDALERLIDEGFEIYWWKAGQVIPLTKTGPSSLRAFSRTDALIPNSLDEVSHAVGLQQHLAPDTIHILDDYRLNHLLNEETALKPRILRVSDFAKVPTHLRESVLSMIRQSKPRLEGVLLDKYVKYSRITEPYSFLCSHLPKEMIMTPQYHFVELDYDEVAPLQSGEAISEEGTTIKLSDLANTLELTIEGSHDKIDLTKLLTATPKLQELLIRSGKLTDSIALASGSLPHLEKIIFYSDLTADNLQILLEAAPNIKEILLGYKKIDGTLKFAPGSLHCLEEMSVAQTNITSASLQSLLGAAPKLNVLNIAKCTNIADVITLPTKSLFQLKALSLNESNITSASLLALLAAAPNIKFLNASSCENITGDLVFTPGSLPHLAMINLDKTFMTADSLQSLVAAAPHLKRIQMNNISGRLRLDPGSLSLLNDIEICGANITTDEVQTLLTATPHLKSFTLHCCRNIADLPKFNPGSLPYLEEATLSNNKFSTMNLNHFFAAASNIKILNLSDCEDLGKAPEFTPGILAHLEKLYLGCSNIDAEWLQALLTATPNLKKIDLSSCENLTNIHKLDPESLPYLEDLDLSKTNISPKDLQTLLIAAPNIKNLNLRECKDLASIPELTPGCLPYLEELNLSKTSISAKDLQTLLIAAPNIKSLWLLDVKNITGAFASDRFCNIEKIILAESPITIDDLHGLLMTAPHLKEISLYNCQNLEGELKLDPGCLPHLGMVQPYGSNISTDALEALKAAAPKLKGRDFFRDRSAYLSPSTSPHAPKGGMYLDADTAPIKQTFHQDRIFYPLNHTSLPAVGDYRLDALQSARTNPGPCTLDTAFYLLKEGDLGLVPRVIIKSATDVGAPRTSGQSFYGRQKLDLTSEWQAMASLSPQEDMLRYNTTPAADVEIQYSTRDNLYYIRSRTPQKVDIDFVVDVPDEPPLRADIKARVDYFLSFKEGALEFTEDTTKFTGINYLDAIVKQKKGACRHRALAFKYEMDMYGFETRIITNICHSFVEVKVDGHWHRCDLGGYPATLIINESNKPNRKPDEPLVTQTLMHAPTNPFNRALQTWDKTTSVAITPMEYYKQCLNGEVKNRLIECSTAKDADALHYALLAYCQSTSKPMFYVNSPDDLICSAPYMHRREDNTGELRRGPGGPLHQFLENNTDGVIIVNYSAFKADDLVRFNTLIDKIRKADGTLVPPETIIIGLLNKDTPNPLPGSDFYSRFDATASCPVSSEQLAKAVPELPTGHIEALKSEPRALSEPRPSGSGISRFYAKNPLPEGRGSDYGLGLTGVINLYNAPDWEERLLGSWVADKGTWRYEEGALQHALALGATTIEIQNGSWENKDVCRFWREALQTGVIHHAGRTIELPKALNIVRRDGYGWPLLTPQFQLEIHLSSKPHEVLNPTTLGNFFSQYKVTADKQLNRTDGLIKAVKNNVPAELHVHLTRELNDDQWAMMLYECHSHGVKLVVYCTPGVELPKMLQTAALAEPMILDASSTAVIQSTDIDTSVAMLVRYNPDSLVIDVSECHDSDLLIKTSATLINIKGEPLRFEFNETKNAVARALEAGRAVILKGRCSVELADELAPLLLKRATQASPSKLWIVSDDTTAFQYLPQRRHEVTTEEKRAILLHKRLETIPDDLSTPFCQLEARCRGAVSELSWAGLCELPESKKDPGFALDTPTLPFTTGRVNTVNAVLAREPYVFLTGLSGVGKTTFVTQELCQKTDTLYQGEPSLLTWAKDTTPGKRKLLFIDEANLSTSEWSAFEGLYNQPPGILIDGEYCPLTPEHKVIFAGNPLNYGGERKLAPFFERHGNAVVFEPLPSNVLYEHILVPIFRDTLLESKTADIGKHLLAVYRFLCLSSEKDLLISPRELQMIALLTLTHCSLQEAAADVGAVTKYFAYQLTHHLVPEAKLDEFKRLFEPTITLAEDKKTTTTDFLITPSRQHAKQLLDEFLNLREIRQHDAGNETQLYGGLGGLILDGEPGVGKSELVIAVLRAHCYKEIHDVSAPCTLDKPFYQMPVSMPLAEKEELLRKAFNEGAVVVIDEINSSPMMERLLNALLMGKTPEGRRPERPGFMVIGTQNPVTMSGRRAPSNALGHRLTTIDVPSYSSEEMYDILLTKGLPADTTKVLVEAYQTQVEFAKAQNLSPAPTFREVLKLAEQTMLAHLATTQAKTVAVGGAGATIDTSLKAPGSAGLFSGMNRQHPPGDIDKARAEIRSLTVAARI